jgi:hypothetical protein
MNLLVQASMGLGWRAGQVVCLLLCLASTARAKAAHNVSGLINLIAAYQEYHSYNDSSHGSYNSSDLRHRADSLPHYDPVVVGPCFPHTHHHV